MADGLSEADSIAYSKSMLMLCIGMDKHSFSAFPLVFLILMNNSTMVRLVIAAIFPCLSLDFIFCMALDSNSSNLLNSPSLISGPKCRTSGSYYFLPKWLQQLRISFPYFHTQPLKFMLSVSTRVIFKNKNTKQK